MFNEKAYEILKSSNFFKSFRKYCVIGASCFAIIGILLIVFSVTVINESPLFFRIIPIVFGVCLLSVPVGFIIDGLHKPFLCDFGTVKSKSNKNAAAEVNGKEIKGTSFEHFLKNSSLENYSIGDRVIIYSSGKKLSRPLFFKEQ